MSANVAHALRALVDEIKAERGDIDEYLIVDDVLERLPRYAAELDYHAERLAKAYDVARAWRDWRRNAVGRVPDAIAEVLDKLVEDMP